MIVPRDYQQEVIDGALKLWCAGHRRIAAVMATGAGKTIVFSHIAKLSRDAGRPTLVLAHRTELIDQAADKLAQVNPTARIGRMQGTTKQFRAEIVVGSIQTCSTPGSLSLLGSRRWGLIVVDECHHGVAETYMRVARELGCFRDDGPLLLGVTATLGRSDGLAMNQLIEEVVEPAVGLMDLIRRGYLVPPRGIRVRIAELDLARVRCTAGDLNAGQLGAAMAEAMAPQRIVEAWTEHAKGRPTIAFLPTIGVSVDTAEAFRAAGFTAAHLDGGTSADARADALTRFRAGEIDVLCNVGLFGEGTDLPMASCVILGRPTSSGIVYRQQVGRGLRLHPGKTHCVVLDVVGNTGRHALATMKSLAGADSPDDIPDDLLMYEDDEPIPDEPEGSAGEPMVVDYADGDLAHELVDLFGESHSAWLRTDGGRWFLPAPRGFVYLERSGADRYDLCWATEAGWKQSAGRGVLQTDMEIGYAMAAGDEYAAANPIWQTERQASWRGAAVAGGRTKGEVFDERARRRASAVLDNPAR